MTTNQPETNYNIDYDDIAQSYFPQQEPVQTSQVSIEQQKMQDIDEQQSQNEVPRSERITIVQAQSVPSNHRTEIIDNSADLPTPAALTLLHSDEEYQNSIANAIMNQKKQFVVGSVIAENFEESPPSVVPEHGPRRRREALRKAAKSLDDNEIDEDDDKAKVEIEASTLKSEEETATKQDLEASSISESEHAVSESSTTPNPNFTYNIENAQNNIFDLFRRIIDMKLRMGLNFLQNATLAFQHYLRGVEQRVNTSPLFNPYAKNETKSNETSSARNSNQVHRVEAL